MSTIAKQYKVPSEKVRQNRRAFYELHRKRDEDIKTWFDRIQSVVNICCKFGRCRQFFIIDKFVSELRTDEIERIEHAITDNWSLQQLSKYFVDEHVSMKGTSSNVVAENAHENQEWTVKTIKCEAENFNEYSQGKPADDDSSLVELMPYLNDDEHKEHKQENGVDESILGSIKCEFGGYEFAISDELEFEEMCDIDDTTTKNSHETQSKTVDSTHRDQWQLQSQSHSPQHPATCNNYPAYYRKLEAGSLIYHCDECGKAFTRSIGLKCHKQNDHRCYFFPNHAIQKA